MEKIFVEFNFRKALLVILITALSSLLAQVQSQVLGVSPKETDRHALQADRYPGDQSLFYYSDIGILDSTGNEDLSNAILMAARAQDGVFKTYPTDELLYIVNFGGTVYISTDVSNLEKYGTYSPQYSNFLTSPSAERHANLSLFIVPIQMDEGNEHWIRINGIGTIIIEDIDPTVSKSILVPSGTIFSLKTISINEDDNCGLGGNHAVVIKW